MSDGELDWRNLLLVAIGIVLGFTAAAGHSDKKWRTELIERGVAEYNETTSEWQWKDSKDGSDETE